MTRYLWLLILIVACAQAQVAAPASQSPASSAPASSASTAASGSQPQTEPQATQPQPSSQPQATQPSTQPQNPANPGDLPPLARPGAKVSLVRGVLKRVDPIHDELLIKVYGDGDVRINFDPRTQLVSTSADASAGKTQLIGIPAGSVLSVDTVIDRGKLFAVTVRTVSSDAAELNGQIVRYDATRSRLTLRDPMSPQSLALRVTPSTVIVNHGQTAPAQSLSAGMLVQVWFSPAQKSATKIEILAERGNSFTFQGRVVSVDLRTRSLALSNDTDQNVHEISIGALDNSSLNLLREGADVTIQAEFDGDRYNARSVALVRRNQQ